MRVSLTIVRSRYTNLSASRLPWMWALAQTIATST